MDSQRFDALSRSLASAGSRRGMLGLLSGLPLAGWLLGTDDSAAKPGRKRHRRHAKTQRQRSRHERHEATSEACIPTGQRCPSKKPRGKKGKRLRCSQCCQGTFVTEASGKTVCGCQPAGGACTVATATSCCSGVCNESTCQGGQGGSCEARTCGAQGMTCGSIPDGCGGMLECGSCAGITPICSSDHVCVACSGANPCPDGGCCTRSGACIANGATCDDGDPCTVDDVCTDGVCGGSPKCGDGMGCNQGTCCLRPADTSATKGLQEAINGAAPGATLTLCAGTWTLSSTVSIGKSLTLIGAGAGETILDGNNAVQVMFIPFGTVATVTLQDLTVTKGRSEVVFAGGITNRSGQTTLTLVGVAVTNNVGTNFGGGIYNGGTTILEAGTIVSGNSANLGGGIASEVGQVRLNAGSRVSNNTDASHLGGGIFSTVPVTVDAAALVCDNSVQQCGGAGVTSNCPNPASGVCPSPS